MRIPGMIACAGLLCLVAACKDDATFADAAAGDDVQIDADTSPDAVPAGQVTVTTHGRVGDAPGPLAGVTVFVLGPDGTAGDSATTGADGTATLDVTAGDSVTAVYVGADATAIATVVAVEPGDNLVFGDQVAAPGPIGTLTLSWAPVTNASYYTLHTPCGSQQFGGATHAYTPTGACSKPISDFAVQAFDVEGNLLELGILLDQPFPGTGTATITDWATVTGNLALAVSGLPAEVNYAELRAGLRFEGNRIHQVFQSESISDGEILASGSWPTGRGERIAANVTLYRNDFGPQRIHETLPVDATGWTVTAPGLTAWIADVITSPALRTVRWLQTESGTQDGALVRLSWSRSPPSSLFGLPVPRDYRWTVVLPPGVTTLVLPPLPAALVDHAPRDGDNLSAEVRLIDLADDAGYAELRARPEWVLGCVECAHEAGELSGRSVEATSYQPVLVTPRPARHSRPSASAAQ